MHKVHGKGKNFWGGEKGCDIGKMVEEVDC